MLRRVLSVLSVLYAAPGVALASGNTGPSAPTAMTGAPRVPQATAPSPLPPSQLRPPPERPYRSGFVAALSLDGGVGSASGYPNDSRLLNDKRAYGRTGLLAGSGFTLSLGGAIAPYLSVSVFLTVNGFQKKDSWKVTSGGGGLRVDAFVFTWTRNRFLRNWAFFGLAGVGSVDVSYQKLSANVADLDGTQSQLGLGTFYEFRFGALGLGPESRFDAVVSRTASRIAVFNGLRLSFYPSRLF